MHDSPTTAQQLNKRARTIDTEYGEPSSKCNNLKTRSWYHNSRNVFEFHSSGDSEPTQGPKKKQKSTHTNTEPELSTDSIRRSASLSSRTANGLSQDMPPPSTEGRGKHRNQAIQSSTLTSAHKTASELREETSQDLETDTLKAPNTGTFGSHQTFSNTTAERRSELEYNDPEADELDPSFELYRVTDATRPMVLVQEKDHNQIRRDTPYVYEGCDSASDMEREGKPGVEQWEMWELEEPGSDEAVIGIPKEHYQPRPSRSRSRKDEDLVIPLDFSKRPEAALKPKKKSKRSKTTAFLELIPKEDETEDDDEPLPAVPELDIPKFEHTKMSENNKGTLGMDDTESPVTTVKGAKKQRGRPKKAARHSGINEAQVYNVIDREVIFVEKVLSDEDSARPRERPAQSSVVVDESSQGRKAGDATDAEISQPSVPGKANKPLREIDGNCMLSKTPEKSEDHKGTIGKDTAPKTPQKSSPHEKGPDKHSPISTGVVKYRVGLSKRARIEPLLRIVRK